MGKSYDLQRERVLIAKEETKIHARIGFINNLFFQEDVARLRIS